MKNGAVVVLSAEEFSPLPEVGHPVPNKRMKYWVGSGKIMAYLVTQNIACFFAYFTKNILILFPSET